MYWSMIQIGFEMIDERIIKWFNHKRYLPVAGLQPALFFLVFISPGAARGSVLSGFSLGIPCGAACCITKNHRTSTQWTILLCIL